MEIQNSSALLANLSTPKNLARILAQLQAGYTLDAVVEAKLAANSFMLKLPGGQLLRAQTPYVLELGQALKLEVVKAGVIPELRIMSPEQISPPEQGAVLQALRQFLPKQQSLADFAVTLRQSVDVTAGKPGPASTAIDGVLSVLLSKEDLTSVQGLKQAISNSGIFLEAKLANLPISPQGDLKGHLLMLVDALQKWQGNNTEAVQKTPAQMLDAAIAGTLPDVGTAMGKALLNKTEAAIARIVLDQLSSLPQHDDKQTVWQLEIPYTDGQHTDAVKLKIKRDNHANPAKQGNEPANWSVLLELNPPGLGILHSRISLVGEKVDTYFWSDQPSTTALVREHIDLLSARYTQAGLAVGQLNALDGAPDMAKPSDATLLSGLLDQRV